MATYFVVDNVSNGHMASLHFRNLPQAIRAGHSYEDDFPHVVNCEDFDVCILITH